MATPINVLIAEDSADDTLVLIRELQHGMPRFSSTEALQEVKNSALDLPVIIVSGNIGEQFAVDAMRAGAHDYIMKDSLKRLAPAIERELREAETRAAHRRAEDTIRHMAYHDALTDLVNRHEFEARLDKALSGHVAGDEMLKQLAVVLAGLVRDNDTLARLGGDEFGILLESCPLDRAREIAENLRRAVEQFRFAWQGRVFSISVSIGVAAISKRSRSTKDVMSAADMTCYAAKDQGRNRVEVFVQNDTELTRRQGEMEWVSRINQALVDDRLVVYQQRIVPLNGADGFGSEMLLRMYDEDEKLVLPGAFIPAAERYNLMPAIDRRVIDLVLAKLAQDQSSGVCFINLSGASLSDHSFFTYIRDTLVKYAISPPRICFEITETAAIANLPAAIEFIRGIKEEGCRFALDDFGSGLSSFSYLKSIPVDFLKIDGAFVRNILVDRVDCAIVEAITCIAQEADIETIAESVEEDAVKQRLQALGVCYAQGYCIEYPHAL
jgi:EAL domain-containing protein (putative c-di-GMP-specific phosphodiesterase class I)/GGDEF domain-containing protein